MSLLLNVVDHDMISENLQPLAVQLNRLCLEGAQTERETFSHRI